MLNRAQAGKIIITSIFEVSVSKQYVFDLILKTKKYPLAGLVFEATYIEYARSLLNSTPTRTIGLANYPLGGASLGFALELTKWCYEHGAEEVDIGLPISLLRSGELHTLKNFLKTAAQIADDRNLKGVIWSDVMSDMEIIDICNIMADCKVNYVKTNPDFGHITSPHIVPLIKNAFGNSMKVVVAGEVENTEQLINFFDIGADFVETSSLDSVLKVIQE